MDPEYACSCKTIDCDSEPEPNGGNNSGGGVIIIWVPDNTRPPTIFSDPISGPSDPSFGAGNGGIRKVMSIQDIKDEISKYMEENDLDIDLPQIKVDRDCIKAKFTWSQIESIPLDISDCIEDAILEDIMPSAPQWEKDLVKENMWMVDLLHEYLDCIKTLDPDPNRRDLGLLTNFIRDSFLQSEIEKRMFEKYILGDEDIEAITSEECAEIMDMINNDPNKLNWNFVSDEEIDGEIITTWTSGRIFYDDKNYNGALGTVSFKTDEEGNVINVFDTYDFDIHINTEDVGQGDVFGVVAPSLTLAGLGCEGRTFKAEWKTRSILVWGALKGGATPFNISCD